MRRLPGTFSSFAALVAVAVLAACSGGLSSGGMSLPSQGQIGGANPAGPPGPAAQSRQRDMAGEVTLHATSTSLPFPAVDGFALPAALGTAPPSPAPTPLATAAPRRKAKARQAPAHRARARRVASAPSPASTEAASPDPSAAASAAGSPGALAPASPGVPAVGATGGAATPSAPSASPPAVPTGAPTLAPPSGKVATKTMIYPEYAPAAPTPKPTGDVVEFTKRVPLVRGFVQTSADLTIYGLGAVRFTVPADELRPGRGYTIAVFENGKKRHERLVASDDAAVASTGGVTSTALAPIAFKHGIGYLVLLYGDDVAPSAAASGFPAVGKNPFYSPGPGAPQPGTQPQGAGVPYGAPASGAVPGAAYTPPGTPAAPPVPQGTQFVPQ